MLQVLDESTMTWNATNPSLKAVRVYALCLHRAFGDNLLHRWHWTSNACLSVRHATLYTENHASQCSRSTQASCMFMSQGRFLHTAVSLLGKSWPYEPMLLPVVCTQYKPHVCPGCPTQSAAQRVLEPIPKQMCMCAYDVQHMKSNTWLTSDLCCLQMVHALSLAVRYAPMQYHVSAVHSFGNRHSMYYCWNMLTAQGSQQQTL